MSETCKIQAGQVKFQNCKPDWAWKIVESKLKKYCAKQTWIPFFKSKQVLLIRDPNGCHCRRRLWHINHIKISKPPMLWQKRVRACVIFFGLLKFVCYLPFGLVILKTSCEDCYRCLPLFILHLCMKYEVCRSNTVRVIALQRSVDRRTDRRTKWLL